MDVNDNKNSDINFQNMVDKNSVSTINDILKKTSIEEEKK